jgi:hypothetical protein
MSFSREGWKSQKILAQVCRDCLSKRFTTTPAAVTVTVSYSSRRSMTTAATAPATKSTPGLSTIVKNNTPAALLKQPQQLKLLESFRNELYHHNNNKPTISNLESTYSNPRVRRVILRRESRKRAMIAYKLMRKQEPALLQQLTHTDLDNLIALLTTNPDDPASDTLNLEALEVMEDLKMGKHFSHLEFRPVDYDTMIYLASELKLTKTVAALLHEAIIEKQLDISIASFEAGLGLLAFHKQHAKKVDFWIKRIEKPWTKKLIRAVVVSCVVSNRLDEAATFLRQNSEAFSDLVQLIKRYEDDDRELLDHALNIFAMDCLKEWRLNDMRLIYARKRKHGMGTTVIVKNLINKCLHTGQLHTATRMLSDTISMKDTANAQLCSQRLIQWYISQKNIKHAILVWEQTEKNVLILQQNVMEDLLLVAAKLKYHVDTMRLYRQLYPLTTKAEIHVAVLKCMVYSKDFKNATLVKSQVEQMLSTLKPNLARSAVRSLYSLAAQTGDLELFERAFRKSQELNLSLTHKGLTTLIATYLKRDDVQSAKAAFQSVAFHTDGPDVVDFNLLMRTVVMEDKRVDYDKIFDILNHMNLVGVSPDETTMRTMLGFYKSESDMQKSLYTKLLNNPQAASRFDQVYLNNIAFGSLLTRMNVEQVVGILIQNNRGQLFPDQENKRIQVNGLTYKVLLDAAIKDYRRSSIIERLLKDMDARGMKPTREVYEAMIHSVALKGKITKARKFIKKMEQDTGEKANIKTYTKLVDGLLLLNKPDLAKKVIEQDMKDMTLDDVVLDRLKKIEFRLASSSSS